MLGPLGLAYSGSGLFPAGDVDLRSRARERQGGVRRDRAVGIARTVALASTLAALVLPTAAMADWPVYGHDLANTRDAGPAGPSASQVGSLAAAWTFKSPTGDF